MRMRKRMLALLAAALLLVGILPVGVLAAGNMPDQITGLVLAEVFSSDANCTITMQAWDALYAYASWEEIENYSYQWKILSGLNQTDFYEYGEDAVYFCTKAEASKLRGKGICQCDVYDGRKKLTTITFKVDEVIYAPVPSKDVPQLQYLYYIPGKPVTISVPTPTIGGNQKLDYLWCAYKGEDAYEDYPSVNAPSITLTLGAEKDRWTLDCQAATKGYANYTWIGSFVLLNRENKPIEMPTLSGSIREYELAPGESETLTLPTATPGDPNKTVEYRWYTIDWDTGNMKFYKTTPAPQLTVTNTPDRHGKGLSYICKAGYKGEPESSFLEYGLELVVTYLTSGTPSIPSMPKTGDNTPLTALFLLLGVSLAGATLLVGMRRRHGHS